MRRTDITATLFIVAFICFAIFATISLLQPTEIELKKSTYTVVSGDSLWNIASQYCPDGMNIWDYIEKVNDANHLHDYTIYPGQVITIYEIVS